MARLQKRNLGQPDEVRPIGNGKLEVVEMGDAAFGRVTMQPGWRWSKDVKPIVGTELCEVHHMGYVISGRLRTVMRDGSVMDVEPGDVFEFPAGHNSWVIGDEPWVTIDWTGRRFFGQALDTASQRVLATILFTDIVRSTELAREMGDHQWRNQLAEYHAMVRRAIEKHRGREVQTTGDGMLASFDSPARGVRCALETALASRSLGFEQRAGLHTGEVELAGEDVRGIAVHLAARVSAEAGPGEVLVSATTAGLLFGSGIETESRGSHELKGIQQPVELFAAS